MVVSKAVKEGIVAYIRVSYNDNNQHISSTTLTASSIPTPYTQQLSNGVLRVT